MTATSSAPAEPVVRVLLVDDDPTARRALRDAAARAPALEVAGEAASAAEIPAAVERTDPDVVVIDVEMPGIDGITATLRLTARFPDVPVMLLTTRADDELALLALRAGASGYLAKELEPDAIVRSMRSVSVGEAAISRRLTRRLIEDVRGSGGPVYGMRPVDSVLTPREWQVLDLLSEGASTDDIAERLVLTVDTVRSHIKHLLRKLGAHSRAEAVEAAHRMRAHGATATRSERFARIDELELRRRLDDLGLLTRH